MASYSFQLDILKSKELFEYPMKGHETLLHPKTLHTQQTADFPVDACKNLKLLDLYLRSNDSEFPELESGNLHKSKSHTSDLKYGWE